MRLKGPSPNDERDSDHRVGEDRRSPDQYDRVPHCGPLTPLNLGWRALQKY